MALPASAIPAAQRSMLESTLNEVARAARYHAWLAAELVPDLVPPVLEIGSGLGTLALSLGRHLGPILASEGDQMLARALEDRCRHQPTVSVVPGFYLPGEVPVLRPSPRSIVLANVLEHVSDDVGALRSIRAQLTSAQRLAVVVPAHGWAFSPLDARLGHHRRYDRATLGEALEDSGWRCRRMRYFNPLGALAWAISGRLFRRVRIESWQTDAIEVMLPLLKAADRALGGRLLGQSLIASADR